MTQTCWRVLKNGEDHALAMARLIELASSDLSPETQEFDEFELLGLLIEHYESKIFPMDKPDPIDAIKFRMDQQGLTQADMKQYIGSSSKVSEVLNRKRPLSLSMIRRIHDGLGIPADILIQDMGAIEWSLVDTDEADPFVTCFTATSSSAIEMASFSTKATETHFSLAVANLSQRKIKPVEPTLNDADSFSLIWRLSPSLTAANVQSDEMISDRNYTLVS